jgi:hypothetical protein
MCTKMNEWYPWVKYPAGSCARIQRDPVFKARNDYLIQRAKLVYGGVRDLPFYVDMKLEAKNRFVHVRSRPEDLQCYKLKKYMFVSLDRSHDRPFKRC